MLHNLVNNLLFLTPNSKSRSMDYFFISVIKIVKEGKQEGRKEERMRKRKGDGREGGSLGTRRYKNRYKEEKHLYFYVLYYCSPYFFLFVLQGS